MRTRQMLAAAIILVLAACGSADAADTTLRYASVDNPDDTLVIEAADGRMRVEQSRGQMVIVRDGEEFLVFSPPSGGRAVARLADYLAVGGEVRARMVASGAMTGTSDDSPYSVREEGARTVGQWQGSVYSINPVNASGVSQEIVISTDPGLAEARAVAVAAFEALERPSRAVLVYPDQFVRLSSETLARGMPISYDGLQLRAVDHSPVAAERLELPQQPLSREQLRELMAR